jgi:D-proline reductase (dithiol) PrdB
VPPFARFSGSLPETKLALLTTSGVHLKDQDPFDIDDPLGDCSYRELPSDAPFERLTWTHYYHAPERERGGDLDCVFPLRTARQLVEAGFIGSLAERHYSFMGAIPDAGPLIEGTAPEVAGRLVAEGVGAVLLTPSCPLCHRTVGLLAGEIEAQGVPTVALSLEEGLEAPRVGRVRFPYNFPVGEPNDPERHGEVVRAALALLEELDRPGERELPFRWRGAPGGRR